MRRFVYVSCPGVKQPVEAQYPFYLCSHCGCKVSVRLDGTAQHHEMQAIPLPAPDPATRVLT